MNVSNIISGVTVTRLSIINTKGGDILHGIKNIDKSYYGFGEAYFSLIKPNYIKG